MKNIFYITIIILSTACQVPSGLSKEEAKKIIESSYKFDNCSSAVERGKTLGLSQKELARYQYKRYNPFPRAIIVDGRLGKVLGISISEHNSKKATVLFSVVYQKTPFYKIRGHQRFDEPSSCSAWREKEEQVTMVKYDTGWRIK